MADMKEFREKIREYYKEIGLTIEEPADLNKEESMETEMFGTKIQSQVFPIGKGIYKKRKITIKPVKVTSGVRTHYRAHYYYGYLSLSIETNYEDIGIKTNQIREKTSLGNIFFPQKEQKTGFDKFDGKYVINGYSWFGEIIKNEANKLVELDLPENNDFGIEFRGNFAQFRIKATAINVEKLKKIVELMYSLVEKVEYHKGIIPENDPNEEVEENNERILIKFIIIPFFVIISIIILISILNALFLIIP